MEQNQKILNPNTIDSRLKQGVAISAFDKGSAEKVAATDLKTEATAYQNDESIVLPAEKEVFDLRLDPNSDAQQRILEKKDRETVDLLKSVLGDKLGKDLDNLNRSKRGKLDDIARTFFEKGKGEEVLRILQEARKVISLNPLQRETLKNISNALVARIEFSGPKGVVASPSFRDFKVKQTELKNFQELVEKALRKELPEEVAFPLVKGNVAKAKQKLETYFKSVQSELKAAHKQHTSLSAKAIREQGLEAKIKKLEAKLETKELVKKQLQFIDHLRKKLGGIRHEGSHQQHSKFLKFIREARGELSNKSLLEVLTTEAGFSSLSEKKLETLKKALDETFERAESKEQGAEKKGALPSKALAGSTSFNMRAQSASSDQPIEAVEAIKKILANEEIEDGRGEVPSPSLGIQSTDPEDHALKVQNWQDLSQGELSMQIASHNVSVGIQNNNWQLRSEEKRLEKALEKIILAIQSGNLDAISLALILIARKSKDTLRKAALTVIQAMKYYEQQQTVVNSQLEKLTGTETTYASQLQKFSSEMNIFSSNRQAAVSMLRDIKATSDELDNAAKSWLDVKGPHERALARWTA